MRRLADRATIFSPGDGAMWEAGCFSKATRESGNAAAICDVYSVMAVVSEDFGGSGKCNYYLAEDVIYVNSIAMAFQVCFGANRLQGMCLYGGLGIKVKVCKYIHVLQVG